MEAGWPPPVLGDHQFPRGGSFHLGRAHILQAIRRNRDRDSAEMFTMELGLMYFQPEYAVDYGGIMAACVITLLPVLVVFLAFRTRIIEGVAFTGMKR